MEIAIIPNIKLFEKDTYPKEFEKVDAIFLLGTGFYGQIYNSHERAGVYGNYLTSYNPLGTFHRNLTDLLIEELSEKILKYFPRVLEAVKEGNFTLNFAQYDERYIERLNNFSKKIKGIEETIRESYEKVKNLFMGKPLFVIPGIDFKMLEEYFPENTLHRKSVKFKDKIIAGYGGCPPKTIPFLLKDPYLLEERAIRKGEVVKVDSEMISFFDNIKEEEQPDIIFFYWPVFEFMDKLNIEGTEQNVGSMAEKEVIDTLRPDLVITSTFSPFLQGVVPWPERRPFSFIIGCYDPAILNIDDENFCVIYYSEEKPIKEIKKEGDKLITTEFLA